MKKKSFCYSAIIAITLLASSCTPRIVGEWNIESYEIIEEGKAGVSANNVGKMTFAKDGTGISEITFNLLGATGQGPQTMKWNLNDNLLTIRPDNAVQAKTWIISEDECHYRELSATDGASQVQLLKLRKLKPVSKKKE